MTKIKTIHVSNLRAIKDELIDLKGCTAIVIAGNNKGKSTLLRSLIDRFRSIKNNSIVRSGERDGFYEMELTTGEKLIWNINNNGKEKLIIETTRGMQKITKEMMQHFFPSGFDIDKFFSQGPLEQSKTLEKLCGLDFSDVNKMYKEAYENRAYANKKFEEEKAKLILFEPSWVNEIRSTEKLEKELYGIDAHNLQYKNIEEKLLSKKDQLQKNYDEIELLKKKIIELEETNMQLETDIDKGTLWLNNEDKKPKDESVRVALQEEIENIRKNNEAIKQLEIYKKCEANAFACSKEIERILSDKKEMISSSDMPEGFSFDDDNNILYNNRPFDKQNQSTSALYIGALKLASRTLGEVKVIPFEASALDKDSLNQVILWAESNNLQLMIERPDFDGCDIKYEIIEETN